MRPLLLLLPLALCCTAEPARWAAGSGTVTGLAATSGQEIPLPATLVAGPTGARIDLGDAVAGEVLLGPGTTAVLSQDEGAVLINLAGAAQTTRTGTSGDLRLRLPAGEIAVAPGVVVAEVAPTGAVVMAVRGEHQARPTTPDRPRAPWEALAVHQALAVEARGLRRLGEQRRPQILPGISVADQLAGRALAPASPIADLADEDRDDLALDLIRTSAVADAGAAVRHLRFLAVANRPMALAAIQVLLAAAPNRAEEGLVALVDGGVPVERAAGIAAFSVPQRAEALARRAIALKPASRAAIIRLVAAAAPGQASAVEALAKP